MYDLMNGIRSLRIIELLIIDGSFRICKVDFLDSQRKFRAFSYRFLRKLHLFNHELDLDFQLS